MSCSASSTRRPKLCWSSGVTLAVLGIANIHQKAEEVTVLHGLISERGYFDRHRNRHSGLDLLQLIVVGIYW